VDTLDNTYKRYKTVRYKKGDIVLMQNVVPSYAYAVKSGVMRSYMVAADWDERSVSFITENEVFPICWLFSKTASTLYYYVAHTDCELYVMKKDEFQEFISSSASVSYALLDHSINDYVTKTLQITALEQTKAISKILHTMNYFALRYGHELSKDIIKINIPLTQKDIASFSGMARETVASELSKIRDKNILTTKSKFYTVNITNLRQYIKDEQIESAGISIANPR
jgi:CRP-like cAMP-binding protein